MVTFNITWLWTEPDMKRVLKILEGCDKPVFHICSGASGIGDFRLDASYLDTIDHCREGEFKLSCRGLCNIIGDMCQLPFKSGIAKTVLIDPPYDYDFTKDGLIKECVRILKPKGKLIFIAPWIPSSNLLTVIKTDLWKVGTDRPYYKVMTLSFKSNGQLGDYV